MTRSLPQRLSLMGGRRQAFLPGVAVLRPYGHSVLVQEMRDGVRRKWPGAAKAMVNGVDFAK